MSPTLFTRVSPQALTQIQEAAQWWSIYRPAAPGAIRQDIAEMLEVLIRQPGLGTPARNKRIRGLRRVILHRVSYYLYYRVSQDTLEILAFWHTSRGKPPRILSEPS